MTFKIDKPLWELDPDSEEYKAHIAAMPPCGYNSLKLEEFKAIDESAPISKGQIGDFWEKVCEENVKSSNHINNKPKNKFYLIFNPQQSAPKHKHYTFEEAQKEAKRIAARHPEQTIYVLETIAAYTAKIEIKEVKL